MSTLKVNTIDSFSGTTVEIHDHLGISGSLTISGSILPIVGLSHDLGSLNKRWDNIHGNSGDFTHVSGSFLRVTNNVDFHLLPTSDPGVSGRLFTQSGSQLPFSGSAVELNAISSSKFVLIS